MLQWSSAGGTWQGSAQLGNLCGAAPAWGGCTFEGLYLYGVAAPAWGDCTWAGLAVPSHTSTWRSWASDRGDKVVFTSDGIPNCSSANCPGVSQLLNILLLLGRGAIILPPADMETEAGSNESSSSPMGVSRIQEILGLIVWFLCFNDLVYVWSPDLQLCLSLVPPTTNHLSHVPPWV